MHRREANEPSYTVSGCLERDLSVLVVDAVAIARKRLDKKHTLAVGRRRVDVKSERNVGRARVCDRATSL